MQADAAKADTTGSGAAATGDDYEYCVPSPDLDQFETLQQVPTAGIQDVPSSSPLINGTIANPVVTK